MNDDDAAIAAIRAAPDDDAPRLVYADELLGRGDARGELIAAQCAVAAGDLPRVQAIAARRRVRKLLATHGPRWAGLESFGARWTFARGFVEEVSLLARRFVSDGDALLRAAPLLRRLTLERVVNDAPLDDDPVILPPPGVLDDLEAALASRAFASVRYVTLRHLTLSYWYEGEMSVYQRHASLADHATRVVIDGFGTSALVGLAVDSDPISDATLRALTQSAARARLTSLDVPLATDSTILAELLDTCDGLVELGLHGPNDATTVLSVHPRIQQLRRLRLRAHAGLDAAATPMPSLAQLMLSIGRDTDVFVAIGKLAPWTALRELCVAGGCVTATSIAATPPHPGLRVLELWSVPLDIDAVIALAAWARSSGVELLDVARCDAVPGVIDRLKREFDGELRWPKPR